MEEVDKILIHALKQVGTEVPEEINSVKQFSSELIVEAVVRCIRVIDPGLSSTLATSLPPGMSARFRVGMSLAQACQDIGYKGELGYQTFLYSSEPEIRSLLMFLVEKLPRESAETSDQPTGKSVVLERTIAAAIKAHLAVPWLPPKCRLPLNCETQRQGVMHSFHVQPLSLTNCTKGSSKRHTKGSPPTHGQPVQGVTYFPLKACLSVCVCVQQELPPVAKTIPTNHQSEGDVQLGQQEELAYLQQQFQQLCSEVDHLAVLDELKQRELRNSEKEEKIQVKKKTIDLLPDADNNLLKLQALVEASAKRVVNLASQWEKHRAPLVDEYRRLKDICSSKDSSKKLSEIKSLHEKIRVSTEEAKKKEDAYKQLVTELENLPQDASRSAYTQRILEIVSNIKKQKEEITKILSDTKELQKEINNLTGKLDRTFAVTDELVFKDAKKDETVRKSYKYLAALHENCNQLIQTIEDTGTILREIRDLEEQIETENGNKTVANLERILEDYKAIRQENASLAAKVREG
uniref:Coiled-coil domain-containing protein 22 n=1 Tax=Neolamprologus brichardi TaxID=32507 RepID=A0A3Q4GK41_NEOBR